MTTPNKLTATGGGTTPPPAVSPALRYVDGKPTVDFLPLDLFDLGVLKDIAQVSPPAYFPIDETEEELPRTLDHLEQLGYLKKGEAPLEACLDRDEEDPDKDYWELTATGRAFLAWQEKQERLEEKQEKQEEKQEKQERTKSTRDWLSLTVSAITLVVSIVALIWK